MSDMSVVRVRSLSVSDTCLRLEKFISRAEAKRPFLAGNVADDERNMTDGTHHSQSAASAGTQQRRADGAVDIAAMTAAVVPTHVLTQLNIIHAFLQRNEQH